jgi:hypothetical protein
MHTFNLYYIVHSLLDRLYCNVKFRAPQVEWILVSTWTWGRDGGCSRSAACAEEQDQQTMCEQERLIGASLTGPLILLSHWPIVSLFFSIVHCFRLHNWKYRPIEPQDHSFFLT